MLCGRYSVPACNGDVAEELCGGGDSGQVPGKVLCRLELVGSSQYDGSGSLARKGTYLAAVDNRRLAVTVRVPPAVGCFVGKMLVVVP